MSKKDKKSLSVFISLILRHRPEVIGIELEKYGAWAKVDELIAGIKKSGRNINMEILEEIVKEDSKTRYSFNEDKTKIRANQGHSVKVYVDMEVKAPPENLYHGTVEKNLNSIKQSGICKMSRLFVHLSQDIETAKKVGGRRGKPIILVIDSAEMYNDGYVFLLSSNGVWQCDHVPYKYVKEIIR